MTKSCMGSEDLYRLVDQSPLISLDIGARGGLKSDLLPIAHGVTNIGFEPDKIECAELNKAASNDAGPWRSLRYIPEAVGTGSLGSTLHLYTNHGCASLLTADKEFAALFDRGDYFDLRRTVEVSSKTMDDLASAYNFTDAVNLKIDVEGAELDVFTSAPKMLSKSLLAVRCEVAFSPVYKQQPLFRDIDACLSGFGFSPMGFLELHHWRRVTKVKPPNLHDGSLPLSRAQIMHGDMLFMRSPEDMNADTDENLKRLIHLLILSVSYQYIDHAAAVLRFDRVREMLQDEFSIDGEKMLKNVSRHLAKQSIRERFSKLKGDFKSILKDRKRL